MDVPSRSFTASDAWHADMRHNCNFCVPTGREPCWARISMARPKVDMIPGAVATYRCKFAVQSADRSGVTARWLLPI